MNFDIKNIGRKSDRVISVKMLKSPAIMASGTSTKFLPFDPNELRDRTYLLLQEKQAGNSSDKINQEIVVFVDKFLEYKCFSKKQHKQLLIKAIKIYILIYICVRIHNYNYSYS